MRQEKYEKIGEKNVAIKILKKKLENKILEKKYFETKIVIKKMYNIVDQCDTILA